MGNQYWFSQITINAFVGEIVKSGGRAALVSSPSIYFSLPPETRVHCKVLDFDRQWEADEGYVFYDFNHPEDIHEDMHGAFDFVLADPPFITQHVWTKYAIVVKLLSHEKTRVLCTTIAESMDMMLELLNVSAVCFRPSIPHLVYQYCTYTNYKSEALDALNLEIDDEDWRPAFMEQRASAAIKPCVEENRCLNVSEPNLGFRLPCYQFNPERTAAGSCERERRDCKSSSKGRIGSSSRGVEVLTDLWNQLQELKRDIHSVHVPLQRAVQHCGTVGAFMRVERALNSVDEAVAHLREFLHNHAKEIAVALTEDLESFMKSLEADKWHLQAISLLISRIRDNKQVRSMEYKEFASESKMHATALLMLSKSVLTHIKSLKSTKADR